MSKRISKSIAIYLALMSLPCLPAYASTKLDLNSGGQAILNANDVNSDGIIDVNDIALVASRYNQSLDKTTFFDTFDINKDGIVDIYDLVSISSNIDGNQIKQINKSTTWWWYAPNTTHTVPGVDQWGPYNVKDYDGMYVANESEKAINLTFDTEYETGLGTTEKILDALKLNNVKATFFITADYITYYPDIVKRMVAEGHTVGNHSKSHGDMTTYTSNVEAFNEQILTTERKYKELIGTDMVKIFRPPFGTYSEQSLLQTKKLGYKSVFWTYSYRDYDSSNQPEIEQAKRELLANTHPGGIVLLHACSTTNANMMDYVIKEIKAQGYTLDSLK